MFCIRKLSRFCRSVLGQRPWRRHSAMASEIALHCVVKPVVPLAVGDHKPDIPSGCRIVDIMFPNVSNPEVAEVRFKNMYVALLTIRFKFRSGDSSDTNGAAWKWKTCLRNLKLMPDPHCETGSQDYFCLTRKQFLCDLSNISGLRLILQQPSPVWKEFGLEEVCLYRPPKILKPSPLPGWLTEQTPLKTEMHGVPDPGRLSVSLQEMWALAEETGSHQTGVELGRYEVDGCYEVNLLSYI